MREFPSCRCHAVCRRLALAFQDEAGTSMVEVMVAIVVFMVIMLGGLNYFTIPHATLAREKMRRVAVATAEQRLETLMVLDFSDISADSNETNTLVVLEGRTGYRNTTVANVDDALDGTGGSDADGDTVDYKTITVDVSWNDGNSQSVTLTTKVSDFGNPN